MLIVLVIQREGQANSIDLDDFLPVYIPALLLLLCFELLLVEIERDISYYFVDQKTQVGWLELMSVVDTY